MPQARAHPEHRTSRLLAWGRGLAPVMGIVTAAVLIQLFLPPMLPQAWYGKIIQNIGINIILAVSLNIVSGYTGQFSIGHAGFMLVGGYAGAFVMYYGSIAFWGDAAFHGGVMSCVTNVSLFNGPVLGPGDALFLGACLVGGLVAALVGVVVGLPSIRLRGDYLAIVTLGFNCIMCVIANASLPLLSAVEAAHYSWPAKIVHLGGALGFSGRMYYASLFWVWLFAGLTVLVAVRIRRSTYGRAFLAIRENEIAAAAMGVPIVQYKVLAFVIAAFFAGIGGVLFAHQFGSLLKPDELDFFKSFDIIIMVVLGGLGSTFGSVVAAAALAILPELLRSPPHVWPAAVVIALALVVWKRRQSLKPLIILALVTACLEAVLYLAKRYGIDLAQYRMIFYALLLILVMILRPQGLFGSGISRVKKLRHADTPAGGTA